jgi:hypothetical protein
LIVTIIRRPSMSTLLYSPIAGLREQEAIAACLSYLRFRP